MKKILTAFLSVIFAMVSYGAAPKAELQGNSKADLGDFSANSRREAVFKIKNAGDAALKIIGIRHTCGGCAEVAASSKDIAPGETAEIKAALLPYTLDGAFSKSIFVETNDPAMKYLNLTLTGSARTLVKTSPGTLFNAGRIEAGKEYEKQFELTPQFKDVELGEPDVTGSCPAQAMVARAEGGFTLTFKCAPEKAGTDLRCKISIPVKKPEDWKPLEITVCASVGAELVAIPSTVFLPKASEASQIRKFTLRYMGTAQRGIKPEDVKWEKIEGVDIILARADDITITATATFSLEFLKKLAGEKKIPIVFSAPDGTTATLNCSGQ